MPETVVGDVAGAEVGDVIGTAGGGELGSQNGGLVPERQLGQTCRMPTGKAASEVAAAEAEAPGDSPVCLGTEHRQ